MSWKIVKREVEYWTKIKYENLSFSGTRYDLHQVGMQTTKITCISIPKNPLAVLEVTLYGLRFGLCCALSATIILPVVLYGCETWSLTLREQRKLRVFENMVLRRIFGPRRDEVTGEWRRLHNEELNGLYSSPNIVWVIKSRRMRWAGHVARMVEEREVYRVLVGKLDGPLGRPRRRWVDNIRMDLQEVGWRGAWTGLIWLRT